MIKELFGKSDITSKPDAYLIKKNKKKTQEINAEQEKKTFWILKYIQIITDIKTDGLSFKCSNVIFKEGDTEVLEFLKATGGR